MAKKKKKRVPATLRWPTKINIGGKVYSVKYPKRPNDVDTNGQRSLWGQIDFWDHSIRVYQNTAPDERLSCLLHEVLHGVFEHLRILRTCLRDKDVEEDFVDALAGELADTLVRNKLVRLEKK